VELKRTQFNAVPGYARTLHGTQAETLNNMTSSLRFGFNITNGAYVLLSRPVSKDAIVLIDDFDPSVLKTPPKPALIEHQEWLADLAGVTLAPYLRTVTDLQSAQDEADKLRAKMVALYIEHHGQHDLSRDKKGRKRKGKGVIGDYLHLAKRHQPAPAAPSNAVPPRSSQAGSKRRGSSDLRDEQSAAKRPRQESKRSSSVLPRPASSGTRLAVYPERKGGSASHTSGASGTASNSSQTSALPKPAPSSTRLPVFTASPRSSPSQALGASGSTSNSSKTSTAPKPAHTTTSSRQSTPALVPVVQSTTSNASFPAA
jgi:hypothetical protein